MLVKRQLAKREADVLQAELDLREQLLETRETEVNRHGEELFAMRAALQGSRQHEEDVGARAVAAARSRAAELEPLQRRRDEDQVPAQSQAIHRILRATGTERTLEQTSDFREEDKTDRVCGVHNECWRENVCFLIAAFQRLLLSALLRGYRKALSQHQEQELQLKRRKRPTCVESKQRAIAGVCSRDSARKRKKARHMWEKRMVNVVMSWRSNTGVQGVCVSNKE